MLCGGLGTRLREETEYRPKPLVEIGGRPILWHIMKLYAHNGFTDFVFCLGYRGNMIKEYFLNYGDGVGDVNIRKLLEFHKGHGKLATVTTITPSSRFGVIEANSIGRVTEFKEKPKTSARASAGFFVLDRRVFDYLGGDDCIFEKEALEGLATDGQLMAFQHDGFFYAMDTYREYEYLNQLWSANQAPWKVWQE